MRRGTCAGLVASLALSGCGVVGAPNGYACQRDFNTAVQRGGTASGAVRVGDLQLEDGFCGPRVVINHTGGTPAWEASYADPVPDRDPAVYAPERPPAVHVLTVVLTPADPSWKPRRYHDRRPGGTLHLQIRDRNPGSPWASFEYGLDGRALIRIGMSSKQLAYHVTSRDGVVEVQLRR